LDDDSRHFTHFTGFMLEEEIVASLWGFGFNIQNPQNHRRNEILVRGILRGRGRKCIRLLFIKGLEFLYQNWTVDVITLTEYTNQVSKFYLQNSRYYKQKTNFDCQIENKREVLKWEEIHLPLIHLRIGICK
jgi:hypothetical protein